MGDSVIENVMFITEDVSAIIMEAHSIIVPVRFIVESVRSVAGDSHSVTENTCLVTE